MPASGRRMRAADGRVFDRSIRAPRWRDFAAKGGALLRDSSRFTGRLPVPLGLPRGDHHPVLVIPAFCSSDYLTRGFCGVLAALDYRVEGWGAGINRGPTEAAWRLACERLSAMAAHGGRVSLVGHSLGGALARALASRHPALIRRVITVCSPFRLPTASRLEPLYRLLSRWHIEEDVWMTWIAEPPPVPTTAIYAPHDGIVAWSSCIDAPAPGRENVPIDGPHSTMLANPLAIRVIADRLARPYDPEIVPFGRLSQ